MKFARVLARAIWLGSVALALFVVAAQAVYWLQTALWPPWSLGDGLGVVSVERPQYAWRGVQKIVDWLLALPLSVSLALTGAVIGNLIWQPAKFLLGGRHGR